MIIKLNGLWKFTIDMGVCGTSYFDVDFPRDFWDLVYVPSVWNFYKDRYYLYEGIGWYVKEFYIEEFDNFSFERFVKINPLTIPPTRLPLGTVVGFGFSNFLRYDQICQ